MEFKAKDFAWGVGLATVGIFLIRKALVVGLLFSGAAPRLQLLSGPPAKPAPKRSLEFGGL